MSEAAEFFGRSLKFSSLVPMLTKAASPRQITDSRNFGNEVYENATAGNKGPREQGNKKTRECN
jgi:hypothetical protein